ncbi:MAG: serine/threonine protein kinase [Prochloraceae cyanobacterium]
MQRASNEALSVFEEKEKIEDRYQLERQLIIPTSDRQTWLAIDSVSQQKVRLRMLALSPGTSAEQLKLFKQEARVLRTLEHPQILKYIDYFDIDTYAGGGVIWFVLVQEYIQGPSLFELLEAGQKFSEKQLISFALEILDILTYLHQLNPQVLHLGIKPSNLILGEDGKIYLIGFGIIESTAAARGVCFNTIGGKGYTPVEQFLGKPLPASDLYALGATIIHLVTGITPADLPQSGSHLEFADRVNLDKNFVKWLEKMTDVDPQRRFQTATEAKKALLFKKSPSTNSRDRAERSKIEVNKTKRGLKINIPNSHVIGWRDYAVLLALILVKLIIFKQIFVFNLAVNYIFWLAIIAPILIVYALIFVFEGTKIYLSAEKLSVEKYIFGITLSVKKFQYPKILNFSIEPYQEILPGIVRLYKKITLNTEDGVYDLAKIAKNEREWFLEEIKTWSNKYSFAKHESSVLPRR